MLINEAFVNRSKAALVVGSHRIINRATPHPQPCPFTATYFPWSVILKPDTLKRALLYFDKVYLLGPPATVLDGFLESIDRPQPHSQSPVFQIPEQRSMLDFYKSIKPLRDAGVVELLDTNEVLSSDGIQHEIQQ